MNEVSKRALKTSLKNYKTKVAQFNQWARQRAGFQWNAVVLLGAILLSLLFVSSLQAQSPNAQSSASTKQGFFAGIVYLQGFGVDTTKTSTTSTSYRINGYGDATSRIDLTGGNPYWDNGTLENPNLTGITRLIVYALLSANCESGSTNGVNAENTISPDYFSSFTEGKKPTQVQLDSGDATVNKLDTNGNLFRTGKKVNQTSHCYRYFYGDLSNGRTPIVFSAYEIATPDSPSASVTNTESDEIKGVGLQFGFRWEKWRASLTHFTGKGGANEFVNTVVMADYFFHEEFFVGGGLASMKLTNSSTSGSTSASATSPVIQVGYKENLTPNLFFNISLTKYISGISLSRSTTPPARIPTGRTFSETQTERGKLDSHKATIGLEEAFFVINGATAGANFNYDKNRTNKDQRIEATQVRRRDVEIEEVTIPATQKTDAEIKAPVVVSISLLWRF